MKILIVGGTGQGKGEYARGAYNVPLADGGSCGFDQTATAGGINRLHLLIRRMLSEGLSPYDTLLKGLISREDWVIVCDEVGSGIVPAEAFERDWREAVGRFCCELAQYADRVERICCGVPAILREASR
ncbi:MAG: bifunctional adenosylcobinamide kinase/adenosylcobinamide-phosphate guanylyltransferase [Oscillospiraceae bacterium]|jgi:adenosyl cobinamide kinase/adenosyl cobinamide phosphate guanylyltransferase|nr:bifunctional adenosylcobinamide kinase/adenosylcobinamide-phosphate guanylyltransferase [Oscillospiraceae bacterium]